MAPASVRSAVTVIASKSHAPVVGWCNLARPKSSTLARPCGVIMMFAGLMSRWISPMECAAARASATCAPNSSSRGSSSGPRPIIALRVSPSTYSITMKSLPSASSIAWIMTMLAWLRAEADRASRSRRCRRFRPG